MSFLYPGFLWALAALAVPLVIHLFHFRRYRTVYFTNVRFLKEVVEETRTRQKLRHWLILALRMLAVAALVLAFAQPVLPGEAAAEPAARRAVSVYVDNTFSMDALGEDRSLLEQARERARNIAEAHGPDDRFQLLTADLAGGQQRLLDREQFLEALDGVGLSPEAPALERVYRRQLDALSASGIEARRAYLISDFQRSAGGLEPDSTVATALVPLTGLTPRNLVVDSVWFRDPLPLPGQPAALSVRLRNVGREDASDVGVKLYLDPPASGEGAPAGREIRALAELDLPAGAVVEDTLVFTLPAAGAWQGEVVLTDYPVTFDDRWFFHLDVPASFPVLAVGREGGSPFLEAVFGDNARFTLESRDAGRVDYGALPGYGLIIVDGLDAVPEGLAAELAGYAEAGGSVLLFPGDRASAEGLAPLLDRVGLRLGGRSPLERPVSTLHAEHPLFGGVFERVPRNLTLPTARLSYRLQAGPASREDPLLSFRDGEPFLARYPLGGGQLIVCASPLTREASDLPTQGGLLVPLLVKLGSAGAIDRPLAGVLGRSGWIDLGAGTALPEEAPPTVSGPDGSRFLPELQAGGRRLRLRVDDAVTAAGPYAVSASDGSVLGRFALNHDRRESDLEAFGPADLREAYGDRVEILEGSPERLAAAVGRMASGRRLWRTCLIFALAFLALETALLRWPNR
jgi:hypothetical protein